MSDLRSGQIFRPVFRKLMISFASVILIIQGGCFVLTNEYVKRPKKINKISNLRRQMEYNILKNGAKIAGEKNVNFCKNLEKNGSSIRECANMLGLPKMKCPVGKVKKIF